MLKTSEAHASTRSAAPTKPVPQFIVHHSSFIISKVSFRYLASALSGALMFGCFPPLGWSLLVWVAAFPLLVALASEGRPARAFRLGYVMGAVFLAGSCYWFIGVMERYGKLPWALGVAVWLLFVIIFAPFFGVFGLVESWVARRSLSGALLLSPALWVSMEFARTYLITGFPWDLLGYAVSPVGLTRLTSVTAVYGLSFLPISISALAAGALLGARRKPWALTLVGWCGLLTAADFMLLPPPVSPGSSSVLLVQPDVPLDEVAASNWAPWRDPGPLGRLVAVTERGLEQARAASAAPLVVWAENPAPFYFTRDPVFRAAVERMALESRAYLVLNTVTFGGADVAHPRNTAIVLDPRGREILQYDKIHLVPFGEYVPWWAFPGRVGKITSEVGQFVPGTRYQVARTPEGNIAVFICYEAIFPQLVRRLAAAGPGVLVNISNDAWYGDSGAAAQHLGMARLRAVENGRFLLRATNDGITAIIDPYGRIVDRIPRHQQMTLAGHFDYLARRTFYTAHGDVFALLCVAVSAGFAAHVAARDRKQQKV